MKLETLDKMAAQLQDATAFMQAIPGDLKLTNAHLALQHFLAANSAAFAEMNERIKALESALQQRS